MSATVEAAIKVLWREPMLDGLPRGTDMHWWGYQGTSQSFPIWMTTYFGDRVVFSQVSLSRQMVAGCETNSGAFVKMLDRQLRLLRMRHWFALAYARGGYC